MCTKIYLVTSSSKLQTIAVKGVSLGFGGFIRFRERVGTQMLNDK